MVSTVQGPQVCLTCGVPGPQWLLPGVDNLWGPGPSSLPHLRCPGPAVTGCLVSSVDNLWCPLSGTPNLPHLWCPGPRVALVWCKLRCLVQGPKFCLTCGVLGPRWPCLVMSGAAGAAGWVLALRTSAPRGAACRTDQTSSSAGTRHTC